MSKSRDPHQLELGEFSRSRSPLALTLARAIGASACAHDVHIRHVLRLVSKNSNIET